VKDIFIYGNQMVISCHLQSLWRKEKPFKDQSK
jgi:hypothetical protein